MLKSKASEHNCMVSLTYHSLCTDWGASLGRLATELCGCPEKTLESDERIKRLAELREQQLPLCVSMFRTTDCYKKLQAMEKASPKHLKSMCASRKEITTIIHKNFIDVMSNLNECYPALTCDDLHYCILSLLHCSKIVITELMDVSLDALKTRKSRIKSKIGDELFAYIFVVDNQWDTE